MTPCLLTRISAAAPTLQELVAEVESAGAMDELVEAVERLVRAAGVIVLEGVLAQRAAEPMSWPECPQCGRRLHSVSRRLIIPPQSSAGCTPLIVGWVYPPDRRLMVPPWGTRRRRRSGESLPRKPSFSDRETPRRRQCQEGDSRAWIYMRSSV